MPFVSEAQRRLFYATPSLRRYIKDFEAATPRGRRLPEHVKAKKGKGHMAGTHFIRGAIKHPGALHEQLGVPQGQNIPQGMLSRAAGQGGKVGERARLAMTLEHLGHKKKGKRKRHTGRGGY